jgi:hypothetical protein
MVRECVRLLIGLAIVTPVLTHVVEQQPAAFLITVAGATVAFGVDEKVTAWCEKFIAWCHSLRKP